MRTRKTKPDETETPTDVNIALIISRGMYEDIEAVKPRGVYKSQFYHYIFMIGLLAVQEFKRAGKPIDPFFLQ